jgi:hypothetical protein
MINKCIDSNDIEFFTPSKKGRVALIVSTFQQNRKSSQLLRVAIDSMLRFKPDDADIWIIDVGSLDYDSKITPRDYPDVNFIVVDFTPRSWDGISWRRKLLYKLLLKKVPRAGSFANAWTLNIALKFFSDLNYNPEFFMTLQMDIMFTDSSLVLNLLKKFNKDIIAVGVRQQKNLSGDIDILHSLGCMWKLKLYNDLDLSMEAKLPYFDVGENAIHKAISHGYKIDSLECSYSSPEILNKIDEKYLKLPGTDRTINKENEVVFMHLGRGISKSSGDYSESIKKTSVKDWIEWYDNEFVK